MGVLPLGMHPSACLPACRVPKAFPTSALSPSTFTRTSSYTRVSTLAYSCLPAWEGGRTSAGNPQLTHLRAVAVIGAAQRSARILLPPPAHTSASSSSTNRTRYRPHSRRTPSVALRMRAVGPGRGGNGGGGGGGDMPGSPLKAPQPIPPATERRRQSPGRRVRGERFARCFCSASRPRRGSHCASPRRFTQKQFPQCWVMLTPGKAYLGSHCQWGTGRRFAMRALALTPFPGPRSPHAVKTQREQHQHNTCSGQRSSVEFLAPRLADSPEAPPPPVQTTQPRASLALLRVIYWVPGRRHRLLLRPASQSSPQGTWRPSQCTKAPLSCSDSVESTQAMPRVLSATARSACHGKRL